MATRDELGLIARQQVGRALVEIEQSAIVELYELYFDVTQLPFRFHAGTNNLTKDIIWNGNTYYSSAIEVEGFEANMLGRLPRPKVSVANTDYIISNILREYSDFRDGKFVRVKLFLKHLDNENFDDNINPFGQPDPLMYISKEKYLISQKLSENKHSIQFELITPFDLQSLETATRAIYGRYCYWQYRGMGCNYQGDLICQENDKDFGVAPNRTKTANGVAAGQFIRDSSGKFANGTFGATIKKFIWTENKQYDKGDIVYVNNIDLNGIKDPPQTWFVCADSHFSSRVLIPTKNPKLWLRDGCSKTLEGCKKRFSSVNKNFFYQSSKVIDSVNTYIAYNDSDTVNNVLPFGGFPGTDNFRYE